MTLPSDNMEEGVRLEVRRSRISRDEILQLFNLVKKELLEIPADADCKLDLRLSVGEVE